MKHVWVLFLCLTISVKIAYCQNHECVHQRKWQIGFTTYENYWHHGKLYVYARCNDSSHVLPRNAPNWNLCESGKLRRGLPRCEPENEEFFKCEVGKRWQDGITKYEVISHDATSYVVAACTAEGFVIDRAASLIRCDNYISNRVLPQCRKGEVRNTFEACATGRKSRNGDYEFQNVWHHGALYVKVFCIDERNTTRNETILCENGKMKRTSTIDFCKIQENDDRACVLGKKWTANYTEYEISLIGSSLVVISKCIVPGFYIGHFSRKICDRGRIPEVLPQCKVVDLPSSTVSLEIQADHTTNRNVSHTTDESIGSSDRNECRIENGGCNQTCNYENRRVQCSCHKGYQLQSDNKTCAEKSHEDACFPGRKWTANDTKYEIFTHGKDFIVIIKCKNPSVFRKTGEWYKLCDQGRIPSELPQCKAVHLPPRTTSTVTNNCRFANGGCDHICSYINGTVQCACYGGYELYGDNKTCVDINECLSQNFGCSHKCLNTPGSAFCSCPDGFTLLSGRKQCTEKIHEDACFSGKKWTANNTEYEIFAHGNDFIILSKCKNSSEFRITGGRWELCEQGRIPSELPQCKAVTLPPRTTSPVTDKCHLTNGGCDPICNYINGTAHCSCNEGYELHWDNKSCIDINECLSQNFGCSGKCLNTLGSAFCSCPDGFTLQSDRKQCTDIDECSNNATNKCHHQCINTEGSHKCSCHPGYVLINDFKCEDKNLLDACATGRSHKDDYEFEYVWHQGALYVRVFCIHEGMETKSETIPCENGKMKRTPPIDFCYEPFFW